MAILLNGSAAAPYYVVSLARTSGGFLSGASDFTVLGWWKSVDLPDAYKTFYLLTDTGPTNQVWMGQSVTGSVDVAVTVGGVVVDASTTTILDVDTWVGLAAVYSVSEHVVRFYIRPSAHGLVRLAATLAANLSAATFTKELLGTDTLSTSESNIGVGYVRSYQRALTIDEIAIELRKESASSQTSLFMDTPLRSAHNLLDESDSGSGDHDWTLIPNA